MCSSSSRCWRAVACRWRHLAARHFSEHATRWPPRSPLHTPRTAGSLLQCRPLPLERLWGGPGARSRLAAWSHRGDGLRARRGRRSDQESAGATRGARDGANDEQAGAARSARRSRATRMNFQLRAQCSLAWAPALAGAPRRPVSAEAAAREIKIPRAGPDGTPGLAASRPIAVVSRGDSERAAILIAPLRRLAG
jgi:hypothetical protein